VYVSVSASWNASFIALVAVVRPSGDLFCPSVCLSVCLSCIDLLRSEYVQTDSFTRGQHDTEPTSVAYIYVSAYGV